MIMESEYDPEIPLQEAAEVSIVKIGQQVIMATHLYLLHLTGGMLVGMLEHFSS